MTLDFARKIAEIYGFIIFTDGLRWRVPIKYRESHDDDNVMLRDNSVFISLTGLDYSSRGHREVRDLIPPTLSSVYLGSAYVGWTQVTSSDLHYWFKVLRYQLRFLRNEWKKYEANHPTTTGA